MQSARKIGSARLKPTPKSHRTGTGGSMIRPPVFVDRPSASEIEAYYLSDKSLPPPRRKAVRDFINSHYVDGGTRQKFLDRQKRVERAIVDALDS